MPGELVSIITSADPAVRDRSLDAFCREASPSRLLVECEALDQFRRRSENLYERVRALFFIYAIHRFHVPQKLEGAAATSHIPFVAIAQGRNRVVWREIGWTRALIGLAAFVILLAAHPWLFGGRPY